jgi:hypothetical protein
MWSDRKPWWAKKAEENKVDKTHYKNWCVIEVLTVETIQDPSKWNVDYLYIKKYKPCAKLNAPVRFDLDGKKIQSVVVDNLTKQEAHEVAKGLNFLDGGRCE